MFLQQQLSADGVAEFGRVVAAKAILDFLVNDSIDSIAVDSGGTGYVVGETFDIDGGTVVGGMVARGVVTAVSSGVVTACKIVSGGAYSTLPGTTGQTTSNASLSGSGLTLDLTTDTAKWTQDRSTYSDDVTDFEWIATSVKSTNAPTIGLNTAQTGGIERFELLTATGYDNTATFEGQPGASPTTVCRLMVPGADPQVYVSSTERRANIMLRDGNFVQYGAIGLFVPFTDTEANYPFPGACFGQTPGSLEFSTSMARSNGASPGAQNSGVLNAMKLQSGTSGQSPYRFRDNLSTQWLVISESTDFSTSMRAQVWPNMQYVNEFDFNYAPQLSSQTTNPFQTSGVGSGVLADMANNSEGWFTTNAGVANRGVQGVAPLGEGGRMSMVVQPHIVAAQTDDTQVVGIIDGYQAVHGRGLTSFEEIEQESGLRFIVFPDTNTGDLFRWVAMEIR